MPLSDHGLSADRFDSRAVSIVLQLKSEGYSAFLVGGCIRDLLSGIEPKDFDVATDATPEEIKACFRRGCRLIGRRFRLAHVRYGREIFEVATFRGNGQVHESASGRLLTENVYGPIDQDAARRDLTVNAMFYDPESETIHDYHGGYEDIREKRLRLIGDPRSRYREDPVRLLRVLRFAAKLGYTLDPETEGPLTEMGHLLSDVPAARLFDENLKLLMKGHAAESYRLLQHYDLFSHLYVDSAAALAADDSWQPMLAAAMRNTDERIAQSRPTTPAFLFAVLLWPGQVAQVKALRDEGMKPGEAAQVAADQVISRQVSRIAIPRRFSVPLREIWSLQSRFRFRRGKRAHRLFSHPRFRAAYDFLLLRTEADANLKDDARWWTELQEVDIDERRERMNAGGGKPRRRRRPDGAGKS
ncbi:MAG: polynucleotide adenylyltransferase PcnB [Pseudomonadota bacterium]